ncbi:Similar to AP-1-like transcription factor; acc. no. Q01663 [Pyronema omphalodes CBS 100304]|uniref:Similar to AP-1-like transcription factor acc. no. Q01663 n=1 Tax=Pyronema omphalodes (strain CBS 100304) TaxID=1076935 RepID=U4LYE8_PYROM|nr:Similar to AP-1-like transcription factor; acc. no. Q01663 [Pyronema omphalodes CBS 100304]
MSGRMEMPRVPPEVEAGFPEHIQNHIYDIRGRSASYSSPSNPTLSDSSQPSSRSPFFSFLKINKPKEDGEKPKRRGPKPDSKPPLTRKQELNRQAQRTHRQRKEFYVKSLEKDVARLRETFTIITKEKTALLRENMRLKEILEQHGIVYDPDMDYGYGQNQYPRLTGTTITDTPITATGPLPPDTTYDHIGVDFVLAQTGETLHGAPNSSLYPPNV